MVDHAEFVTTMVFAEKQFEALGPGLTRSHLEPGGVLGPHGETRRPTPGGQGWNDLWLLGSSSDPFHTLIPDIRLPPNQMWPLHWHDCWIAVVILDGLCLIGDWWMEPGDVLVSAAELEYGPVVAGPDGCQLFEIGAQAHLFPGGYAPEYADHVTLQGSGPFNFMPRSERNRRNEGKQVLPVGGVNGLVRGHLAPGERGTSVSSRSPTSGDVLHRARAGCGAGAALPRGLALGARHARLGAPRCSSTSPRTTWSSPSPVRWSPRSSADPTESNGSRSRAHPRECTRVHGALGQPRGARSSTRKRPPVWYVKTVGTLPVGVAAADLDRARPGESFALHSEVVDVEAEVMQAGPIGRPRRARHGFDELERRALRRVRNPQVNATVAGALFVHGQDVVEHPVNSNPSCTRIASIAASRSSTTMPTWSSVGSITVLPQRIR